MGHSSIKCISPPKTPIEHFEHTPFVYELWLSPRTCTYVIHTHKNTPLMHTLELNEVLVIELFKISLLILSSPVWQLGNRSLREKTPDHRKHKSMACLRCLHSADINITGMANYKSFRIFQCLTMKVSSHQRGVQIYSLSSQMSLQQRVNDDRIRLSRLASEIIGVTHQTESSICMNFDSFPDEGFSF